MTNERGLSTERIRELAKEGAEALLKQLRAEIVAIERTFPEFAQPRRRKALVKRAKKRTHEMSAAARRTVSERMKKYWAERKKATAKRKS